MAESTIQFEIHTPLNGDILVEHVKHALTLGLPELRDFEYAWEGALKVIANGPSARQADLSGKTLAINGALKLFTDKGLAPTDWIGCDPQELVADFLTEAPIHTTYLVASKCHPRVFEALRGRNVIVWHVHDSPTDALTENLFPVCRAVSVTICAFEVMARLGWRKFDTWGWDGCVMDGQEHAVAQTNMGGHINIEVTTEKGTRNFTSIPAWALESEDAISALRGFPFPIHIHGGGMMGALLSLYLPVHMMTDDR